MINKLLDTMTAHGHKGAVVPFSRVADIKQDMLALKNGAFHTSWLDRMANYITGESDNFIPGDIGFAPRSLISVVMPSPKAILQFHYRGKRVDCVLPTHYLNWELNNTKTLRYISDYLSAFHFSAVMARTFPQKLLAVHCGLGEYGRNNICYNNEFGSYMQIMTYISDLPCDEAAWFPLKRLDRCDNCHACASACPTGAIDGQRQLINSDRCITVVNELPGEFPEWLKKDAHNSITGCTKCQDCCPANACNRDNVKISSSFTEEETTELLNHKGETPYSSSLGEKIASSGISPDYTDVFILPRNLAALIRLNTQE